MSEQGHPLFSPRIIPDNIPLPEIARYLRMIYQDVGLAFARQQQDILNDPRFGDDRVAHSLRGMAQAILIIDKAKGSPGDVLTLVDQYNCVFASSVNPGPGGVTPSVTPHNILSATHADTTAAAVVRGDLMTGQGASPLWKRLAKGANGEVLLSNGTDLLWGTPLTGGGWTDDGTIVRLTTNTDQVGIGTVTPGALLGLVNVNNVADILLKLTAKASQTGNAVVYNNSAGRQQFGVTKNGIIVLGNASAADTAIVAGIFFANDNTLAAGGTNIHQVISWMDSGNSIGPPTCTADQVGCVGSRIYTYKDSSGQYDAGYGQDNLACWALCGDESITYDFWTGGLPGVITPFQRCSWAGNGDLTNFGKIRSRKSTGAASKGIPGIELEETGSGTDVIAVRAPSAVAASRVQTLLDLNGTIPVVGDDPPAVASRALGKVDSTGLNAAVASTGLSTAIPAGLYAIEVYAACTIASGSGAPTLDVTIGWTDVVGATTANAAGLNGTTFPLSLAATGRAQARFIIQVASGNITYATTINAASGSPVYALYIRVVALG